MSSIDELIPANGLVAIVSKIITTRRRGRRTETIENIVSNFGSGFIVDGELENGLLRNSTTSTNPIVVSVAHVIPKNGTTHEYFFKLFDSQTNLSKIYRLNLLSYNRSVDICVYKFESSTPITDPLCLQWNLSNIKSGQACHLIGYPLGDSQLSIVNGSIRDPTYCFSDLNSGIDQIYHSAPATNGNSGSCLVDNSGNIVGIHAWGYNQNSTSNFENFSGGPATRSAYRIISHMINSPQIAIQKYQPRLSLGIQGKIINDVFRISNFSNTSLRNIDGIIIQNIIGNTRNASYTVDTYNRNLSTTPKIQINDIITHIFDGSSKQFVEVGYTKYSPVNILFTQSLTSSLKIKLRKISQGYSTEYEITFQPVYLMPMEMDDFYSTFI
jgi:hypothetical protein